MTPIKKEDIEGWIEDLKNGKIQPDHLIKHTPGKITLLQAVLLSNIPDKKTKLKTMIDLGCDVDKFSGPRSTPITMAATDDPDGPSNIPLVEFMLEYHQKGHRSDLDILKAAGSGFEEKMFEVILKSDKVDTNVTTIRGGHILHYLAVQNDWDEHIRNIFEIVPDTNPNPLDKNGQSPLALAINEGMEKTAFHLSLNGGKVIGKLENPKMLIELGMVDTYKGDFWYDHQDLVQFATDNDHLDQLPEDLKNIFLF